MKHWRYDKEIYKLNYLLRVQLIFRGLSLGSLPARIVILTVRMLHFARQVWTKDLGLHTHPLALSGASLEQIIVILMLGIPSFENEFGPPTWDSNPNR